MKTFTYLVALHIQFILYKQTAVPDADLPNQLHHFYISHRYVEFLAHNTDSVDNKQAWSCLFKINIIWLFLALAHQKRTCAIFNITFW